MPKLLKNNSVIDDQWQVLATNTDDIPEGPVIVPLTLWQEKRAELKERAPIGVWLNSDQPPADIIADLDKLSVVAINFPMFTDGRGFSYARELREQHGYKGEIRAIGAFIRDQLFYMKRCGFDSFALNNSNLEEALQSFNDFSNAYQASVDQPRPLFRRR